MHKTRRAPDRQDYPRRSLRSNPDGLAKHVRTAQRERGVTDAR
jgi:hypothetical protein